MPDMKNYFTKDVLISVHLVIFALTLIVGTLVVHFREETTATELRKKITEQNSILMDLAIITDRNGSDEALAKILQDCSRRNEYEALLIQLGTLEKKELITIQNLHESCGLFYAQQKALMVQKLKREMQSYHDLITLYALFDNRVGLYKEDAWNELLVFEEARSTLLFDLGTIQEKIVTGLISGTKPQNAEIQNLVRDAQEMSELLGVHDRKIDEIRESLNNS